MPAIITTARKRPGNLIALIKDPELSAIVVFSLLGLLISLCLILLIPFSDDVAVSLAQLS
jgi:uncharacterized MnhB-related membrane protein